MRVAIFDFDGTLYQNETFDFMMRHLKHHPEYGKLYGKFFRRILPLYTGYKMKLVPSPIMKEKSMRAYLAPFSGISEEELTRFFRDMAALMRDGFNPEVVRRVHQHAEAGDRVMLVSGAFTPLLREAVKDLPFDDVIGTDIPYSGATYDGQTNIYHIRSERKNERIHSALGDSTVAWEESAAFGDTLSDMTVLELVGNPVAVRPEEGLRNIASERKWEIIG
ncbi:HAD family hydrolase [Bhargavaea beijingensis]|uniref:HAD-IB family hydrolase n=1 Tax=Bhargavaea beijingensis TaxID=426756 RepID=A0A1G6ZPG5_9BACL|nr:HAD-IB family hydrolase [Bhargavaea beijingensis]MCW1928774.1 HAD-IB family hydrolase [Bhargavaea beijingensis]RSK35747.1 HAD-IB family hydrolase [Bhargavaea beijingensis]SDE04283.1 HAD-superfamily subfamily IB hydrolase, TIGR01490 [Bhargavaea beijingensis]